MVCIREGAGLRLGCEMKRSTGCWFTPAAAAFAPRRGRFLAWLATGDDRPTHSVMRLRFPITPIIFPGLDSLLFATSCQKASKEAAQAATSAVPAAASKAAPASVPEPVQKLLGKWLRADGGYVLELRSAEMSGVVQAAYFNPKSINVSRAIWMQGGTGFQVVVELNDVGYPGATYVLSHDAQSDRLVGKYNQPAMQQSFDIEFVRQPNP
jgi:hypothetical protein